MTEKVVAFRRPEPKTPEKVRAMFQGDTPLFFGDADHNPLASLLLELSVDHYVNPIDYSEPAAVTDLAAVRRARTVQTASDEA